MADSEWYFSVEGQQFGPVSSEQLREMATAGRLRPNDFVWRPGLKTWVPAAKVKGLFPTPGASGQAGTSLKDRPSAASTREKAPKAPAGLEPSTGGEASKRGESAGEKLEDFFAAEALLEPLPSGEAEITLEQQAEVIPTERERRGKGPEGSGVWVSEVFPQKASLGGIPTSLYPPEIVGVKPSGEAISDHPVQAGTVVLGPAFAWTVPCFQWVNRGIPTLVMVALFIGAGFAGLHALVGITKDPERALLPNLAMAVGAVGIGLLAVPAAGAVRTISTLGSGVNPALIRPYVLWTAAAAVWLLGFALLLWNCFLADRLSDWIFLIEAFFWFVLGQFSAIGLLAASATGVATVHSPGSREGEGASFGNFSRYLGWSARILGLLVPGWLGVLALWGVVLTLYALLLKLSPGAAHLGDPVGTWGIFSTDYGKVGEELKSQPVWITGTLHLIWAAILPFLFSILVCLCRMGWELGRAEYANAVQDADRQGLGPFP